jgi:hypothetical protein
LKAKGLVIALTPEGRGHALSHALYRPQELETLRAKYAGGRPADLASDDAPQCLPAGAPHASPSAAGPVQAAALRPPAIGGDSLGNGPIEAIRRELDNLRTQAAQLRHDLDESLADQGRLSDELRTLKDALGA